VAHRIFRRAWYFLARMDVAVVLILVVVLLAIVGSCFPQLPPKTAADPDLRAQWETVTRSRYGAWANLLSAIGVFRFFRSPPFLIASGLLLLATLVCTLQRWPGIWRQVSRWSIRGSDAIFRSAPFRAQWWVAPDALLPDPIHELLWKHGFRVSVEMMGDGVYLRGDRNQWTPLATVVTHLAVWVLLLGVVISGALGWREEVVVRPGDVVTLKHHRDLAVRQEGFEFVRYPDGSPADYEARIALLERTRVVNEGSVRVNHPLKYEGIRFYLHGYAGQGGAYLVALQAVYDPGYPVIVVGGILLLIGMMVSFYFPHSCVWVRMGRDGELRIAGRAGRYAYAFDREFATLVRALRARLGVEGVE